MAIEEQKQEEKCSYCEEKAVMQVNNLLKRIKKGFCAKHFGEFVSNGHSKVYEQFLAAVTK